MNTRIPALLLLAAPLIAGELTVQTQSFRIEHRFEATVLPVDPPTLSLDPETWTDFTIESLVDHGTPVKKGAALVTFKREAYDRRVEDLARSVLTNELAVARQRTGVEKLAAEHALALEAFRRAKETAAEDLGYFLKIGRPAAEAGVENSLVRARFGLESAEEELKQLKQMYEADDLTEATEEIILRRQQISVESAQFQLAEAERSAKRKLETELPRQLEALERAAREAAIAHEKTHQNLPRQLEEARLALQGTEAALAREKLELERLKADAALFEWKAPADGICFHGDLDGDAWDYGDLGKVLKTGGTVPLRRALLTLVPADAAPRLHARVAPEIAADLKPGDPLALKLPGNDAPVGKVAAVDAVPGPDGKLGVTVTAEWPGAAKPKVATQVECLRVAYYNPEALIAPSAALVATAEGGWAVEVKLADGKSETRRVKRGPSHGSQVEIREGLEPGQVIITRE